MSKAYQIKQTLRLTRLKRMGQDCKVFQLKIDESKLGSEKLKKLNDCFVQAKWIYNNLVSQNEEVRFNPVQKTISVNVFDPETQKCDKTEVRALTIGSQIKQGVCDRFVRNIINLSKAKKKGFKVGKLKFKKNVSCIPLKQFGNTYRVIDGKTILIQGIGKLKVRGLEQLEGQDIANANLVKNASGLFVKVTCYQQKQASELYGEVGIDFGIKDNVVLSDGRKFSWNFEIPEKLKRKQRRLSKKKRASKNYVKLCGKIKKNYEEYSRKKDDAANKFVASLKGYARVIIQDEAIKGWHAGLFGKQVQQSILGRIKSGISRLKTSTVIDRWLPTTKLSPVRGVNVEIGLGERVFVDGDFREDRDVKSAKTILCLGLYNPKLTSKELRSLLPEDVTSVFKRFYRFEDKSFPSNEEALPLAAG